MLSAVPDDDIARILEGTWRVAATNLPFWIGTGRRDPSIRYERMPGRGIRLRDVVEYRDARDRERSIVGVDRLRDGVLRWRGRGLLGLIASTWRVTGIDPSQGVVTIAYDKTLVTPAGIDVLVREGSDAEARTTVSASADDFDLAPEAFASLRWLRD